MEKSGASEDNIRARLRELTDATRRVRKDLEEFIRKPHADPRSESRREYHGGPTTPEFASDPNAPGGKDDES